MDAFVILAEPTSSLRAFAITSEVFLAVVNRGVMLTGDIQDLLLLGRLEHLIQRVEFTGLGHMAEVAGVNDEFRRVRKRIDLLDRRLKGTRHVGIGGLGKPDVTVADLNKA